MTILHLQPYKCHLISNSEIVTKILVNLSPYISNLADSSPYESGTLKLLLEIGALATVVLILDIRLKNEQE